METPKNPANYRMTEDDVNGRTQAGIYELMRTPVLTAYHTLARFVELRRRDTHDPVPDVFSINFETGVVLIPKRDETGMFELDEDRKIVMVQRVIDLSMYYLAFKKVK